MNKKLMQQVGAGAIAFAVLASGSSVFAATGATTSEFSAYGDKLFSVQVNNGVGQIAYSPKVEDLELRGPESFAVATNGDVYLLDTIDSQVEVFTKDGKHKNTITLPSNVVEFVDLELAGNDTFYVLNDVGLVLEYKNGKLVQEHNVPFDAEKLDIMGLFQNDNNSVVVRYLDGSEIELSSKKKTAGYGGYKGKRTGNTIEMASAGDQFAVAYTYEPAGTQPLQKTANGERLVLENEALIGKELYVETRVGKYKNGKKVATALAIPNEEYVMAAPNQTVYTAANGKAYQMLLKDGSVEIYELKYSAENKTNINTALVKKVQPGLVDTTSSVDGDVSAMGVNLYGRTDAYNRAINITGSSWTYQTSMATPTTTTTKQPDFLVGAAGGSVWQGIPYSWGGFDSLDTASTSSWTSYKGGLAAGKDAGNVHTSGHGYISSTVGLDCSGFISAAYKFSYKFSTGMLATDANTPFKTTTWASLVGGDIANDAGSHVWMFISKKTDASGNHVGYFTREATTSGTDNTKYYSRTLSEASAYVPMTLK